MARRAASMGSRAPVHRDASPALAAAGTEDEEITRCLCGNQEFVQTAKTRSLNAAPGLYVQCERCNVWQHGFCMGFSSEADIPNEYYCELCEPGFHYISTKHSLTRSQYAPPASPPSEKRLEGTPPPVQQFRAANNNSTALKKAEPTNSPPNGAVSPPPPHSEPLLVKNEKLLREDTRKRRSRPSSDESPYLRNRKQRRSREDEILQRVLEESAREAREAESRRRSQDGSSLITETDEIAVKEDSPEAVDRKTADSVEVLAADAPAPSAITEPRYSEEMAEMPSKTRTDLPKSGELSRGSSHSRRVASESHVATGNHTAGETARKNTPGPTPTPPTNQKSGVPSGSGPSRRRPRATRNTANGAATAAAVASPRRNGGSRRSKTRTPSQRSTLTEMRRRVATILDFSSRTQDELIDDQKNRIVALQPVDMSSEDGVRYEQLLQLSQTNLGYLEDLTLQLLKWEERFGISSP